MGYEAIQVGDPPIGGGRPYDMATKLDSYEDRLICITQGVVQDVFYLPEDVNDIRPRSVECIFIRTSTGPPTSMPANSSPSSGTAGRYVTCTGDPYGSVSNQLEKEHKFALSLPRLMKDDSLIGLAFWAPPKDPEENYPHWRTRLGPMNSYKHTGSDLVS